MEASTAAIKEYEVFPLPVAKATAGERVWNLVRRRRQYRVVARKGLKAEVAGNSTGVINKPHPSLSKSYGVYGGIRC